MQLYLAHTNGIKHDILLANTLFYLRFDINLSTQFSSKRVPIIVILLSLHHYIWFIRKTNNILFSGIPGFSAYLNDTRKFLATKIMPPKPAKTYPRLFWGSLQNLTFIILLVVAFTSLPLQASASGKYPFSLLSC